MIKPLNPFETLTQKRLIRRKNSEAFFSSERDVEHYDYHEDIIVPILTVVTRQHIG